MISIKVAGGYLDLQPGTQIKRERRSPFFLSKESGSDGIPGEVSYPFNIPLTDGNMRKLGFVDHLAVQRGTVVDQLLFDDINQISAGKLQLGKTTLNLSRTNLGSISANLLCNSSHFAKLIADKKLSALSMGGTRSFGWAGFNLAATGFWKHIHDTWNYTNCDDGDYVFFPVKNEAFGAFVTYQNKPITATTTDNRVRLTSDNVMSLTPHVYVAYVIRCIFEEHGYTVGGTLMDDADFKTLCMLSFRSVEWSQIRLKPSEDGWVQLPLSQIDMRLNEHMPPDWTCGQFLVELCKLFPLGLDIDDNARHCTLRLLGRPSTADYLKDMTSKVSPQLVTDPATKAKKYQIKRNFGTDETKGGSVDLENLDWINTRVIDDLPLPVIAPVGAVYLVKKENAFYTKVDIDGVVTTERIGYNTGSYLVDDATDSIDSSMVPVGQAHDTNILSYPPGSPSVYPNYVVPMVRVEGNWPTKPELSSWGVHLAFYKGFNYPLNNGSYDAPYATHTNSKYVVGGSAPELQIDGAWSLAFELEEYGLYEVFWKEWLKILGESETITGTLNLALHEYLKLKWADEILIENTSFILTKLEDTLPFTGAVNFEAVRWIKG